MSLRRPSPFLLLCGTGLFAIFSSTISKTPALPLFAHDLGASEADIGFIAAASTVVGILVSLPAGSLSDLYGRRWVILAAGFVFATAPFLYLLVQEPWQLVAVRVYHGLATAIFGPVAMALVADLFVKGRGESMGWYSSATLVGRFIAPLAGGALLFFASYRWLYLVCGIGGLTALALAWRLPDTGRTTGAEPLGKSLARLGDGLGAVVRSRPILVTSAAEAMQYFSFGAFETFVPLYAMATGGLNTWQIGIIFGAQLLMTTLSKPVMGRTSDRIGRRPLIALGLGISAVAVGGVAFGASFPILLLAAMLYGLGLAVVTSSTSALVSEAAVVGYPHEIKGMGICAFVSVPVGTVPSEADKDRLR
ncbi:MAG: MFS transporter, partial [Dehalococcoidales bacterium]|nr:MFS transporter [Dehalococcoidales bacterium]